MADIVCKKCDDPYPPEYMTESGMCEGCVGKEKFAAFAKECGLESFPRPDGERYVYNTDGSLRGKKGECTDFIDELWNALARAKGRDDLTIGRD